MSRDSAESVDGECHLRALEAKVKALSKESVVFPLYSRP